jgi:hypothetical protein
MNLDIEKTRDLAYLLDVHRPEILAESCEALGRARLRHYQEAGAEACAVRLGRLLDLVVESVAGQSLVPIVQHAERVAWQRYEAGFDFREVHTAFNVLEEAIWKQVVAYTPIEDIAGVLSLIGTVLGAGKEALAAEFVSLATHEKSLSLNLAHLFEGVEGTD